MLGSQKCKLFLSLISEIQFTLEVKDEYLTRLIYI